MDALQPTPEFLSDALRAVRERRPLVQCLTNVVVTGFTANVLLAAGASPAMADDPLEAGGFAEIADGVLVNLGTATAAQRDAMRRVAHVRASAGQPWVLDPVAVGVLPVRTALCAELLAQHPTIVRGNASEIAVAAGHDGAGRGTDSTISPDDAADAARTLARATGGAVAVSGAVDLVTDGSRVVRIANGDAVLTRVTGGGCALGAVMAAFAGAGLAPSDAAVAATAYYTVAAEHAAARTAGPGSFAVALLDALATLTPERLASDAVVRGGALTGAGAR